ncbi:energy-coupling factor transporter ATP-binding protein EcfA2 [Methylobacterium brachiatum]|uniref:Energy-coupling factor transporter ATP-binding protein EcfA2 n=1 Tax=Methylobacterium brachiatum TaxID=269660 RepID=A0AAJ1WTD4_9HYPH|nr:AAA family ATPase [Methylobacterium brachiatum]MCB4802206.1 ATP-binding protein [Methylobacterium brachiatum]MDQ0542549.1 energy-coupling factor transporter ATP-binding protein EcfA2 [Methylobacterium brachiatum]
MKLDSFRVTNFRSVEDSGEITLGDMICLVGKNEAGKTALLHALAGLNPHPATPIAYDKERDYPRRYLNDYRGRHPEDDGEAVVVTTQWTLSPRDIAALAAQLGPDCLRSGQVTLTRRYEDKAFTIEASVNLQAIIEHLMAGHELDQDERAPLAEARSTDELRKALEGLSEPTDAQASLLKQITALPGKNAIGFVYGYIRSVTPQLMYFSHYDRMSGQMRVDDIVRSDGEPYHSPVHPHGSKKLNVGEKVFLDFLEFAGTSVEEIKESKTYESLNAKCESASNAITDQLREYWTQNAFLEIEVRVTKAEPNDPAPFDTGVIARARVKNTLHRVSVPFSERSAGFIWFFSFLVKFAQVSKDGGNLLLLLDEPGLTLHGKAQADLLRYFDDKLVNNHQVVFSTHSPFMVPPEDLTLSRIVEDQIEQKRPGFWTTKGTKVRDDVLATDPDTLFPLQAALGYDVTQALFIGKHTLLVEGPGDLVFLKALSAQLKRRKRTALDPRWTICPAGGLDKIQSFVSLFKGAKLHLAVMSDRAQGDKRKLEQLRAAGAIPENRIMNYPDVLGLPEGDVEDVFDPEAYLAIVNAAYGLKGRNVLTVAKLDKEAAGAVRLVKRVEAAFKLLPADTPEFDHFTPADWLIRNPAVLDERIPAIETTLDNAEKIIRAINGALSG